MRSDIAEPGAEAPRPLAADTDAVGSRQEDHELHLGADGAERQLPAVCLGSQARRAARVRDGDRVMVASEVVFHTPAESCPRRRRR